jgi:predicted GNAT superfamily acetyltransferase
MTSRPVERSANAAPLPALGDAEQDAEAAARRAQVTVREVDTVSGLLGVAELISQIWDAPLVAPMPHDLMRSLAHAGGCVHAAFRDGHLAGACVAIFGPPAGGSCYSLIAGVKPGVEGQGIGLALKLAQRAWGLQAGVSHMTWTFDPLLRRNARFNITRLGAVVTEYLVDFYGQIADGVNDQETDRLAVTWNLSTPLPLSAQSSGGPSAPAAAAEDEPLAILAGQGGEPVLNPGPAAASWADGERAAGTTPADRARGDAANGRAVRLRCWIPEDIMSVRRTSPQLARRWRLAMREALGGALGGGYRVTGLMEPGWYVLEKVRAGR